MEEIDYQSLFDHIDDLPDFACEDSVSGLDGNGAAEFDAVICPDIDDKCIDHLSSSEGFGLSDSVFPADNSDTSDFPAQPSDPYEDIVPLEWLANFIEDSYFGGGMTIQEENPSSTEDFSQNPFQFQTTSPDSVLESSSSCSNAKTISLSREKRARSKRSRPATFNPRPFQIRSPPSSCIDTPWSFFNSVASSVSEGFASTGKISRNETANPKTPSQSAKKCMHCQITKTAQWREGPLGPGTLCNACGIRYKKSGELFPEYRPAASPTYVPSQHSNVRRKVLEMRSKNTTENSGKEGNNDEEPSGNGFPGRR